MAEFRAAIFGADFSHVFGDGGVIARIRALIASHENIPPRPDPHAVDGDTGATASGADTTSLLDLRQPATSGTASDGDHSALAAAADPDHALAPGGARMVGVSTDLPWQSAFGFEAISPNSVSLANREPRGVLDAVLAFRLFSSSLYVDVGAELPDGTAAYLAESFGRVHNAVLLTGDFSSGFTLTPWGFDVDQLAVLAGHDYNLLVSDDFVGPGGMLTIDAGALGGSEHITVDGSAETDGRFSFSGGRGDDFFFGGAGADRIAGGSGADALAGGGGSDIFVYLAASDSTGPRYDMLADFKPGQDKIDLPVTVSGFDAAHQGGALSAASFNADLGAALSGLGAGHAMVYAPNAGDLAGKVFLVVDGNGVAGYQAGEDYVFALPGGTLADLAGHADIFI